MHKVTIKITTENAAFEPDAYLEVARILRELAADFQIGNYIYGSLGILDVNGNRVGEVTIR